MKCEKDKECPGNTLCIDDHYHGKYCGCQIPFMREGDYCICEYWSLLINLFVINFVIDNCFVSVMSRNCSTLNPCPQNQECIYSGSGYGYCICPKGFTLEANGFCRDIDECKEMSDFDLCGHNAECINIAGSYECVCLPGYSGEGKVGCSRICMSNYLWVDSIIDVILCSDQTCQNEEQCPSNHRCLRNACECVPPFIQDGQTCKRNIFGKQN